MKLKTARRVIWGILAVMILIGFIQLVTNDPIVFIPFGVAFIAELLVFFVFIKCPHCGHHLDRTGMKPDAEFCPFCGGSLKE